MMKNLKYIFIATLFMAFSVACENDAVKTLVSSNPVAPTIQGPSSPNGLQFVKGDAANEIDFDWTAADFGYKASVAYTVQLSPDESFETAATLITTADGSLSGSVVVGDINGILLSWGFAPGEENTVKCRVKASIGDKALPIYSDMVDYTVVAYETLIDYPMIYVPGAYQGWSPGADNGRLYSYGFNTVYEGTIRIIDAGAGDPLANTEFKIAPAPNWDNSWGGSLVQAGNDYSGTLDASGGNFSVVPGVYEFTVDTDALTISMTKTDDWGLIGSATPNGWGDPDSDMQYNGQRQMWEVTLDLVAGEIKFRANDSWDLNYGDTGADGSLDAGGDNIAIAEDGNYTIRLDLVNNTYKVLKN